MRKIKGIWLYGLSGSGKSYLSRKINVSIKNSIIVDGDSVRKWVSTDLGYSKKDREIQINRIFGISKIIMNSNFYLIVSSVYFNSKLLKLCLKNKILVYRIRRLNFGIIKKKHKTYKNIHDVLGRDIVYPKLKTKIIVNDNTTKFDKNLLKIKI